jgi:hypothetical protein
MAEEDAATQTRVIATNVEEMMVAETTNVGVGKTATTIAEKFITF